MRIKFKDSDNKECCFSLEEVENVEPIEIGRMQIILKNGNKHTVEGKVTFIK